MEGATAPLQLKPCHSSSCERESVLVLEHFFLDATEPERMVILRPSMDEMARDYHAFCKRIREDHFHEPYLQGDTINIRLYTDELEGTHKEEVRISEEAWQSVFRRTSKIIVRATSTINEDHGKLPPLKSSRVRATLAMVWRVWEWFISRIVLLVIVLSACIISTNAIHVSYSA